MIHPLNRGPWGDAGELQADESLVVSVGTTEVTKDLPVMEAGGGNCLVVDSYGPGTRYPGKPSWTDHVFVPSGAGTVDYEDLTRVDPGTLAAVVPPSSEFQIQLDELREDLDDAIAGTLPGGVATVDTLGQATTPGTTALKVTGATLGDRQAAFRTAIGGAAATHTHVATTDLTATGTKNTTTFLRGDNTWQVPPGSAAGLDDYTDISSLPGYPSSFTPSAHAHAISDTTGLSAALAATGGLQIRTWDGDSYEPAYDSTKLIHHYKNGPWPPDVGQTFGANDQWFELITPVPGPANTITIDGVKRALAGTDITRGTGQIVRYLRSVSQTVTPTGPNGIEVVVSLLTGLVVSRNDRVASGSTTGTTIAADTYVLSGEGKGSGTAGQWLLDNAAVSDLVVLTQETVPGGDPDPDQPPVIPSGMHATPVMMAHAGLVSGAPAIGSYPAPVLAEVNTIVLNYGQAATSGTGTVRYATTVTGQTAATVLAAVNVHKNAGRDVYLAIGGGGGSDNGLTVTNDTEADQMVASIKALVTSIGINGVVFDIQSTRYTSAAIVRVCQRLKTDLGAGFVIGFNNKSAAWLSVMAAVADNFDFISPGLWAVVDATDSRLTAYTTSQIATIVAAGVPAAKIIPMYSLGSAGSNLTPTTALVDTAWLAAKAANPNLRGIAFYDDNSLAARTVPYDGPLNVGPTVTDSTTGRYTSMTLTRDGSAPTTELDAAWTYAGTATLDDTQLLTLTGGSTAPFTVVVSAATRAYAFTGLTPGTAYSVQVQTTLSDDAVIQATASQSTGSTAAPGTGAWISGASGDGVYSGAFGTWRSNPGTNDRPVEIAATWSTSNGSGGPGIALGQGDITTHWNNYTPWLDWSCGGMWRFSGRTWATAVADYGGNGGHWDQMIIAAKAKRTVGGVLRGTVIRFAHELNGSWYDWRVQNGEQAAFIASWREFHRLKQLRWPEAKLCLCQNANTNMTSAGGNYDWTTYYPGDAYVDLMGVDFYSGHWGSTGKNVNSVVMSGGGPFSLEAHRQFALAHGKALLLSEWGNNFGDGVGLSGTGDAPDYIRQMWDYFKLHGGSGAGNIWGEIYFNVQQQNAGNFGIYPTTKAPQAQAAYLQRYRSAAN
jgi:hypothetical protein